MTSDPIKMEEFRARRKALWDRIRRDPDVPNWLSRASILDVETTALHPSDPNFAIWESAILEFERGPQAGFKVPRVPMVGPTGKPIRGAFYVRPETREGVVPLHEWSGFSRRAAGPRAARAFKSPFGPADWARVTTEALRGRDIWVQNLQFESRVLAHYLSDEDFSKFAESLETRQAVISRQKRRLYTTTPEIKRAVRTAQKADTPQAWKSVFGAFQKALSQPPPAHVTRVFDIQDLSKSIFGMAQESGFMRPVGGVSLGSSVDLLYKAIIGLPEKHAATRDALMEGDILGWLLGTGKKLFNKEGLSEADQAIFGRIDNLRQGRAEYNAYKNLSDAWLNLQMGRPVYETIGSEPVTLNLIDQAGKAEQVQVEKRIRAGVQRLDEVVENMKVRDQWSLPWEQIQKKFEEDVIKPVSTRVAKEYPGYMPPTGIGGEWNRLGSLSPEHRAKAITVMEDMLGGFDTKIADELIGLEVMRRRPAPVIKDAETFGSLLKGAKGTLGKYWWAFAIGLPVGISALAYFGRGGSQISSDEDDYLVQEGLSHGWYGQTRPYNTDFGSGYKGHTFDPGTVAFEGLRADYQNPLMVLPLTGRDLYVEDADTVLAQLGGREMSIRLEGIDAPEVAHDQLKWAGARNQYYADEAKKQLADVITRQKSLMLVFDPQAKQTYGRTVGILVGDRGLNINLALVRSGAASYLPFGRAKESMIDRAAFAAAQESAFRSGAGMWQYEPWRASELASRGKVTHITLTDPSRLYQNMDAARTYAAYRLAEDWSLSHQFLGRRDAFNTILGIQQETGDFGSPHKNIYEMASQDVARQMAGTPVPIPEFVGPQTIPVVFPVPEQPGPKNYWTFTPQMPGRQLDPVIPMDGRVGKALDLKRQFWLEPYSKPMIPDIPINLLDRAMGGIKPHQVAPELRINKPPTPVSPHPRRSKMARLHYAQVTGMHSIMDRRHAIGHTKYRN